MKEFWNLYPQVWKTEADFWAFIRGNFRRIWSRWPIKNEFKKNNSYPPPPDYTGRGKKLGTCALCNEKNVPISKMEVDHITQIGGFNTKEKALEWFWELLCDTDNMQLVHKECHRIKSYADRMGVSFASAKAEKEVILLQKQKKDTEWLLMRSMIPETSKEKRRKQIVELMLNGVI